MLLSFSDQAEAKFVIKDGNSSLRVGGFVQPTLGLDFDKKDAAGEDGPFYSDFYVRRLRFIFVGKIAKNLGFKAVTLSPNMGKAGNRKAGSMIGDAWLEYKVSKALNINFGLLRSPFARHWQVAGPTLHGIDFHGFFMKDKVGDFPTRDFGVSFRGLLMGGKIDYRFMISDGADYGNQTMEDPADPTKTITTVTNEDDMFRLSGRVAFNLWNPEPGQGFKGTYLGKKKVFTVGASFDMQPGVGGDDGKGMYSAFALDTFMDMPMGKNGVVWTFNFIKYGEGGPMPGDKGGMGLWTDVGYRVGKLEPLVALEWYAPDNEDSENKTGKHMAIMPGINFWAKGHAYNIKTQFGMVKDGAGTEDGDWMKSALIQAQMMW